MITGFLKDLRFALRQLLKARGFLTVAVLTLALGIGANTAIFTLIHAIMFKSLPVAHPETLVRVGDSDNCCVIGGLQGRFSIFSYPLYIQLRDNTPEFDQMAAFQAGIRKVGVRRSGNSGMSEPFAGEFVSGNYFSMLGVHSEIGRMIEPADDTRSARPIAIISYRAWQHYGGDASILGSTFIIDGTPYSIMGVAPQGFFGETLRPDPPDFWLPLATEVAMHKENALLDRPDNHWLYIIGRIKPGFDQRAVESKLNAELLQWLMSEEAPSTDSGRQEIQKQHIGLVPAGGGVALLQQDYERDLRLLLMITTVVLLIACANVANLQLARGVGNAPQMAIRVALGAGRGRVMRQVLTESILLAVIGGVAGLLVAAGLTQWLIHLAFDRASYVPIGAAPDLPVLGFAFLLSLVSGTMFGAAPAWSASGADPAESLRRKSRSGSASTTRLQKSLVFLQAALSLTLLTGAGLLVRTVRNLQNQHFGYELNGRTVVNVNAGLAGYGPERMAAVYNSVDQRMRQIPGVTDATLVLYSPMSGNNWQSGGTLEDHPDTRISPSWDRVSPSFFRTIGARLLRGRLFDERDTANATHVAVINKAFAEKYLPDEDPLGKRFGLGGQEHRADYQIVGIVDNVLFRNPRRPDVPPMFFVPLLQMSEAEWADSTMARSNLIGSIILHVSGSPPDMTSRTQTALAGVDPNLTTLSVVTMEQLLHSQVQHERLITQLAELLGVLALVLASIGLYGITSYAVVRRTSEIGVRTALGATRSSVIGLVLKSALVQMAVGLLLGIPGALFAGRILSAQLYQVNASDPWILAGAAAVVILSAAAAAVIPAIRAGAIDPIIALRAE
jgi:predicted permease